LRLQTSALDAPRESGAHFVSDHFILVVTVRETSLHLPSDVSRWAFGIVDDVVHMTIPLVKIRGMQGFPA
jgi:hypothetical protein